jgi:hypothetical protein
MDKGCAASPQHSHCLGGPAVIHNRLRLWREPACFRAPGNSRPKGSAISLHTAALPLNGPTVTNPSGTPLIPWHIHPQGPQVVNPHFPKSGRRMPRLGPTEQKPAQIIACDDKNIYKCNVQPGDHCVGRWSQACIHFGRDPAQHHYQHQQPTSSTPQCSSDRSQTTQAPRTTRSGHIRILAHFNTSLLLRRGWCGNTLHIQKRSFQHNISPSPLFSIYCSFHCARRQLAQESNYNRL